MFVMTWFSKPDQVEMCSNEVQYAEHWSVISLYSVFEWYLLLKVLYYIHIIIINIIINIIIIKRRFAVMACATDLVRDSN